MGTPTRNFTRTHTNTYNRCSPWLRADAPGPQRRPQGSPCPSCAHHHTIHHHQRLLPQSRGRGSTSHALSPPQARAGSRGKRDETNSLKHLDQSSSSQVHPLKLAPQIKRKIRLAQQLNLTQNLTNCCLSKHLTRPCAALFHACNAIISHERHLKCIFTGSQRLGTRVISLCIFTGSQRLGTRVIS